jgi:4-hydroxybenzoate polyprenyltransferase
MLKIIRPNNLLLMALLQCLVLMSLGNANYLFYDIQKTCLLVLSTLLIAAAGYIINDYFDVKIDLVNKPDKVVVGSELSRRWAIISHITFTAIGLVCAYFVNIKTFGLALFCALLLYFYSSSLKKQFLVGNLAIALLSAISVLICQAYIGLLDDTKLIAYSFFAASTTFMREIIKDIEDEKGDALFQSNTLPISLGLRKTKRVLMVASIILLLAIIAYLFIAMNQVDTGKLLFMAYAIMLFAGVAVPLVFFIVKLDRADRQQDFAQLSGRMKVIMLIGILSILFS